MSDRIPPPGHFAIDDDGAISATWFHGTQGSRESWRATLLWQPTEGFYVFKTDHVGSHSIGGNDAGIWLRCLLDIGWGPYRYSTPLAEIADEDLAYQAEACARIREETDPRLEPEIAWLAARVVGIRQEQARRATQLKSEEKP